MNSRKKAVLSIAAVTVCAVLLLAMIAGVGSAAVHTGFFPLLRRMLSAAGGVVLLLAGVRLLTHRTVPDKTTKETGKPPLPITAGLLSVGVTLVLLACLIDYAWG